jgi:hypothetical protein
MYQMQVVAAPTTAGEAGTLAFSITDADGTPVTDYEVEHSRLMHLMVVRDTAGRPGQRVTDFQHLHPDYLGNGEWQLPGFAAANAGTLRLFADFTSAGHASLAEGSLTVAGGPAAPPVDASGGYSAHVVSMTPMGDATRAVVELDDPQGHPLQQVTPYLGAPAHWALFGASSPSSGIDFAHAHPAGDLANGTLSFELSLQQADAYQGWIQFQPAGAAGPVTVPLSPDVTPSAAATTGATPADSGVRPMTTM